MDNCIGKGHPHFLFHFRGLFSTCYFIDLLLHLKYFLKNYSLRKQKLRTLICSWQYSNNNLVKLMCPFSIYYRRLLSHSNQNQIYVGWEMPNQTERRNQVGNLPWIILQDWPLPNSMDSYLSVPKGKRAFLGDSSIIGRIATKQSTWILHMLIYSWCYPFFWNLSWLCRFHQMLPNLQFYLLGARC